MWSTRFNLIWSDADLGTGGKLTRSALAASFTVLAIVVAARLWQQRRPGGSTTATRTLAATRAIGALAAWTTVVWLVRGTGIVVGDHSVGFILVHTVLAIVSIALAALAWRETTASQPTSPGIHQPAGSDV